MLNDEEIKDFVEAQVPQNTKQKTKTDLDIFKRWMKSALPGDHLSGRPIRKKYGFRLYNTGKIMYGHMS
jgi:hypothetical protein